MSLAIREEHAALAAATRRFLEANCPSELARAALDAEEEARPPFWPDAADMGWFGLPVDYGLEEAAIVVEELARGGAPGPFLATMAAVALIGASADPEAAKRWLPGLVDGTLVGAVTFPSVAPLVGSPAGIEGVLRPVMGGGLADVVVAPVASGGGVAWYALPVSSAEVEVLPSLDPTRRVAALRFKGGGPGAGHRLDLAPGRAEATLAALVAAECAGGAAWCLDTATEYAKARVQFGRPIGQFQAVKHRCADMLIAVEQIRSAAWDAAAAVAQNPEDPATVLSAAIAASVAAPEYLRVAEACVQVLGGVGFTWEHDAHRYLRRATSLVALGRPAAAARRVVVQHATEGVRRRPASDLPAGHEELRAEIRALAESIAAQPKEARRAALVDAGLFVPHWARPWGRDAGAVEQVIIDEELERAGLRRSNLAVGAWAAPTIAAHGTIEQQERWVGPTLLGRIKWCQLFSEPGAGSDLASLTTRATRRDGEKGWRLNGQKVWTSMAGTADFGICLARTNPSAPKHLGITYFVVDMHDPGFEIRPLREMTGHAMFNEVFLDDVFVPDDHVVGEVDGGWALARTTLANERVAMGSGASFGGGIEALLHLVASIGPDRLDPVDADRLGALLAESHCLSVMGRRSAYRAVTGARPGPESSVRKLLGAEHDQRVQEFGLYLLGPEGATTQGAAEQWTFGFLANRCLTIAGGTSEVQRNVISERLLGLPRDPEP
ncbi:MAG TPA: acyl-CoA dehydrogenase [Acidimicrobiales bacterium]|nr:acyl-CoA dehydrogenase [Acidimicrobiales bacterium]